MESTAAAALEADSVSAWPDEMRRAVGRRESLPAAACNALAQLLQGFLEEETTDRSSVDEVRNAIALLNDAAQRRPLAAR